MMSLSYNRMLCKCTIPKLFKDIWWSGRIRTPTGLYMVLKLHHQGMVRNSITRLCRRWSFWLNVKLTLCKLSSKRSIEDQNLLKNKKNLSVKVYIKKTSFWKRKTSISLHFFKRTTPKSIRIRYKDTKNLLSLILL